MYQIFHQNISDVLFLISWLSQNTLTPKFTSALKCIRMLSYVQLFQHSAVLESRLHVSRTLDRVYNLREFV